MSFGRLARTALLSGIGTAELSDDWVPGPLPLEVKSPQHEAVADVAGRSALLDRHATLMTLAGPRVIRHWRWLNEQSDGYWGAEFIELRSSVRPGDSPRCCLVLHQSVNDLEDEENLALAFCSVDHDLVERLVPGMVRRTARGRSVEYNLRLITPAGPLVSLVNEAMEATPQQQWLWSLASGTLPEAAPAATHLPGHRRVDLSKDLWRSEAQPELNLLTWSSDWQALVLRDGTGFVGLGTDTTGSIKEWSQQQLTADRDASFLDFGELYMRTVYADVFLIGEFQRWGLADLSAAAVEQPAISTVSNLSAVRRLDGDLANFRRWDWWESVASSGPADAMLRAYQDQHQLPKTLERCNSDVEDASRIASEEADQRLTGALAVISTIGLPIAACLAAAEIMAPADQDLLGRVLTLVGGLVASGVLSAILLLAFPGLRAALRDSFTRSD